MKKTIVIFTLLAALIVSACAKTTQTRKPAGFPENHPMHGIK